MLLVVIRPPATPLWILGVLIADECVLHTCRELPWLRQSTLTKGRGGKRSRQGKDNSLPRAALTYLLSIVSDGCSGQQEDQHVEGVYEVSPQAA